MNASQDSCGTSSTMCVSSTPVTPNVSLSATTPAPLNVSSARMALPSPMTEKDASQIVQSIIVRTVFAVTFKFIQITARLVLTDLFPTPTWPSVFNAKLTIARLVKAPTNYRSVLNARLDMNLKMMDHVFKFPARQTPSSMDSNAPVSIHSTRTHQLKSVRTVSPHASDATQVKSVWNVLKDFILMAESAPLVSKTVKLVQTQALVMLVNKVSPIKF